jgi:hypothetical protein
VPGTTVIVPKPKWEAPTLVVLGDAATLTDGGFKVSGNADGLMLGS